MDLLSPLTQALQRLQLYPWRPTALFTDYYLMGQWPISRRPISSSPPELTGGNAKHRHSERKPTYQPTKWHDLPACRLDIFRLAKQGCSLAECEDAWALNCNEVLYCCDEVQEYVSYPVQWLNPQSRLTIAISDGASDSFASAEWAHLLTKHAVINRVAGYSHRQLLDWISDVARHWHNAFDWETLPWYAQEKAAHGAHATLLVLDLTLHAETKPPIWNYQVLAIGDSCLFHFQDGRLVQMIPTLSADDFGNTPGLVATSPTYNRRYLSQQAIVQAEGQLLSGDEIWLATDALSAWLAEACSKSQRRKPSFPGQLSVTLLDELRISYGMRNDDITLVRLRYHATTGRSQR